MQLRFEGDRSPFTDTMPTQSGEYISAVVKSDAEYGRYRYKVWAHFPANPGTDYQMEDPDIEIVQ